MAEPTFREYAEGQGYKVDWNPEQGVLVNGQKADVSPLTLANGRYVGTSDQYESILQPFKPKPVTFRDYATQKGYNVGWNPQQGAMLNDIPVNMSGLQMQDGRYVGTPQQYDQILNNYQNQFAIPNPYQQQQQQLLTQMQNFQPTSPYTQQAQQAIQGLQNFGQYQSPYEQNMAQALANIQGMGDFKYDPNNDQALKIAQDQASRAVREQMGARGMLYSDATASQIAQEMGKLVPQFEDRAYQRYNDKFNRGLQVADLYQNLDQNAYQKFADSFTRSYNIANTLMQMDNEAYKRSTDEFTRMNDLATYLSTLSRDDFERAKQVRVEMWNAKTQAYQERQDMIKNEREKYNQALDKLNTFGYADNDTAAILGIPVNTPSWQARQFAEQKQFDLDMLDKKIQAEKDAEERNAKMERELFEFKSNIEQKNKIELSNVEKQNRLDEISAQGAEERKTGGYLKSISGSGGSSSGSSKLYTSSYDIITNELIDPDKDPEGLAYSIIYNEKNPETGSTPKEALGNKYDSAVKASQKAYYEKLKNSWADSDSADIESSLTKGAHGDEDYYKKMLGSYYTTLRNWGKNK